MTSKIINFLWYIAKEIDQVKGKYDTIIVMGEWNTRIGNVIERGLCYTREYGESITNRSGR